MRAYLSWLSKVPYGMNINSINHERMSTLKLCLFFISSFTQSLILIVFVFALIGCEDTTSSLSSTDHSITPTQSENRQAEVEHDEGFEEDQESENQIDSHSNSENISQDLQDSERQDEFYDPQIVQQIELIIDEQDQQAMINALPEQIYVPATFKWRELEIENVGVRFKGTSSSQTNSWWKRSFLIKFGEYVEGQRFLGLRRVSLDNAVQFGSLFSERLITDIMNEARGQDYAVRSFIHALVNSQEFQSK